MDTVFLICAIVGGTLATLQFLLALIGLGGHHDVDHTTHVGGDFDLDGHASAGDLGAGDVAVGDAAGGDLDVGHDVHVGDDINADMHDDGVHHGSGIDFWWWLSFRAIVGGVAAFGFGGKAALAAGLEMLPATGVALAAGVVMVALVAHLMRLLTRFEADGTIRMQDARGAEGSVYVNIPGSRGGSGRVQITLQGRTVEVWAITYAEPLPTGTRIVVTDVLSPDTVEVIAVAQMRSAHVHAAV